MSKPGWEGILTRIKSQVLQPHSPICLLSKLIDFPHEDTYVAISQRDHEKNHPRDPCNELDACNAWSFKAHNLGDSDAFMWSGRKMSAWSAGSKLEPLTSPGPQLTTPCDPHSVFMGSTTFSKIQPEAPIPTSPAPHPNPKQKAVSPNFVQALYTAPNVAIYSTLGWRRSDA